MRGGGAQGIAPAFLARRGRAAIHNQPITPDGHFKGKRAGMGEAIRPTRQAAKPGGGPAPAWRRPGIHNDHGAPGLQALKAGFRQFQRAPPARLALRQHQIKQSRVFFPRAIEQRQAAIAMAEQAQSGGSTVQSGQQMRRRFHSHAMQQVADFNQVLQRRELLRRGAFNMPAIGQELTLDLGGQEADGTLQIGVFFQSDSSSKRALQRHQSAAMLIFRRQGADQIACILRQALHHLAAENIFSRGREEIPMAEPGGNPRTDHFGRIGDIFFPAGLQPIGGERTGAQPCSISSKRAQIPHPGEPMGRSAPGGGGAFTTPGLSAFCGQAHGADGAGEIGFSAQQARAAGGIAGPKITKGAGRGIGHPHGAKPRQFLPGAAQQIDHAAPPRSALIAAA